jgi:UPF0755 protein
VSGGRGGYPGPGYGGPEYGEDDYGPGRTPPASGEPQWDDSVWQRDQPDAWDGQHTDPARGVPPGYDRQGYQPQGYDPQPYDPQGYNGQGYGGQDYDQPGYAGQHYENQPYPGQPYEDQPYEDQGYADRGVPGAGPSFRPQGAPSGAQQYPPTGSQASYPGSGPYPAQPGQRGPATGARPVQGGNVGRPAVPPGYDPGGTGSHRMAAAGGGGYDDPRREEQQGEDSFLPGFGPRDDFEGGRGPGQDRSRNGGRPGDGGRGRADRGQAPGPSGYDDGYSGYDDPRTQRGPAADPRRRDPRDPAGFPDGPGDFDRPARPGRRQAGRGPDPRTRDPRRGAQGGGGRGNGTPIDLDDAQPRGRRRSPIRRLAPWIALLVIVVPLALVGWHIYGIWKAKTHPADYAGGGTTPTVTVQVASGETADQLASTLLTDGVVASTRAFVLAAENSSDPTGLEPGFFVLNHHMQASLAWAALLNPKNRDQTTVTIPEGKRTSQVIATLAKLTKIPLKDFQQVIDHPAQLGLPSYADGKVEGFLFPATYAIEPHETALQILQAMVARYNLEAQQIGLAAAANKAGISERDVIIEASMAQAEGGSVSDYPKIERVILNRLRAKMPLQFDSVLLYGLNKYAINVTDAQIATPGPYNDFEHSGLPPGPIANPGNAAIEGVLHPVPGDWLYFLTYTNGKSVFSATPLKGQ